jgi:peptide/nickel transport system permease protein
VTTDPWQSGATPPGGDRSRTVAVAMGDPAVGTVRSRSGTAGLRRSPAFLAALAVLLFWIVDAVAWRSFAPHDPQAIGADRTLQRPSAEHWFGTDDLGRDVFSRVLAGASSVLMVAPVAALLAVAAGVAVGLVAGYVGGAADELLMRLTDALLAFPLVVGAVLALAVTGVSRLHLVIVIALVLAPLTARTVRAAVRSERGREYVEAARLRGDSAPYIMVAEILPNVSAVVVAETTTRLAAAIFAATTLSFLGLGIQQPSPDWGLSVALGRVFLQTAPWIVLFPALALATLVVATTTVADALRERIER